MRTSAYFSKRLWLAAFIVWTSFNANLLAQSFSEEVNDVGDLENLLLLHLQYDIPRGDVDGNGTIEFADFLYLSNSYGQAGVGYENGDLNLDGEVGLADYGILSTNFGITGFTPDPPSRAPIGNLGLSLDAANQVLVSSETTVDIVAMEITSPSNSMTPVPGTEASPFTFFLANESSRITWGNLAGAVKLEGDLDTRATSSSNDLTVSWVEAGSFDVYTRAFGAGDALTGRVATTEFVSLFDTPAVDPLVVDPVRSPLDDVASLDELVSIQREQNLPRSDFDGSGSVEFSDFLVLYENYGNDVSKFTEGDVNLDGQVGLEDFAVISNLFGGTGFVEDPPPVSPASLSIASNDQGRIVISSVEDVELGGVEFTSETRSLFVSENDDASPFTFSLSPTSQTVLIGNLGSSVTVAAGGALTTNVRLRPGDHNVAVSWFQAGSYDVFSNEPTLLTYDLTTSPIFFADIDGDGQIRFADFLVLSNNYGSQVTPFSDGDIDGDGEVQFPDFVFLAFHFGESIQDASVANSVPEPSGRCLLLFAATVGLWLVRRQPAA